MHALIAFCLHQTELVEVLVCCQGSMMFHLFPLFAIDFRIHCCIVIHHASLVHNSMITVLSCIILVLFTPAIPPMGVLYPSYSEWRTRNPSDSLPTRLPRRWRPLGSARSNPLFDATRARKKAEQDSILLANRIRLLRAEEARTRKKISDAW